MRKGLLSLLFIISISFVNAKAQINLQEQPMWCWASCIQSALYQANISVSQAQVVTTLTGWPQNRPATSFEVIGVLKAYGLTAWAIAYPANYQQLYQTLNTGWKLIAFVNPSNNPQIGHFIMLQGIAPNGLVVISDPANGQTYQQHIQQLYTAWNWKSSIVVGRPQY